jgi:hypothetical protein
MDGPTQGLWVKTGTNEVNPTVIGELQSDACSNDDSVHPLSEVRLNGLNGWSYPRAMGEDRNE